RAVSSVQPWAFNIAQVIPCAASAADTTGSAAGAAGGVGTTGVGTLMAGAVTTGAGVGTATAGAVPVGIGDADGGGRQPSATLPKAAWASGPLTISSPRSTNDSSFGYRLMPGTCVPVAL